MLFLRNEGIGNGAAAFEKSVVTFNYASREGSEEFLVNIAYLA